MATRLDRAAVQRMYLVEIQASLEGDSPHAAFVVVGSTGNVYTVKLGTGVPPAQRCNCMDAKLRKKQCKHQLFVMLRVLALPRERLEQLDRTGVFMSSAELKTALEARAAVLMGGASAVGTRFRASQAVRSAVAAAASSDHKDVVVAAIQEVEVRMPTPGEADCPICFEPLIEPGEQARFDSDSRSLVYCRTSCGNTIHKECFDQWSKSQKEAMFYRSNPVTCVYCRAPWVEKVSPVDDPAFSPVVDPSRKLINVTELGLPPRGKQPASASRAKTAPKKRAAPSSESAPAATTAATEVVATASTAKKGRTTRNSVVGRA